MFAIRQKSTGWFLPAFMPNQRKGGTWLEPDPVRPPRLWPSRMAANNALTYWLKGRMSVVKGGCHTPNGDWSDANEEWTVESVSTRRRSDMEVVEVEIRVK